MEKSNLWNLVKKGQEGDKKSMEELYNMFMPLLKKYAYLTHTEDALSEITLSFIEGIMKMPINKDNFKNSDKYILSYINTTVKHGYIAANSSGEKYQNNNFPTDDFSQLINDIGTEAESEKLWFEEIRKILSEEDFRIIVLKYKYGFTDKNIAAAFGVTRQAINKRLKKIGNIVYNELYLK